MALTLDLIFKQDYEVSKVFWNNMDSVVGTCCNRTGYKTPKEKDFAIKTT
jgi:hypothetical protein